MTVRSVVAAGGIGLVAVSALAVARGTAAIEHDLEERAAAVLVANNVTGLPKSAGRDLTVTLAEPLSPADTGLLRDRLAGALAARTIEIISLPPAGAAPTTVSATTATPTTPSIPATSTTAPTTTVAPTTSSIVTAPRFEVVAELRPDGTILLEGTVFSLIEQIALTYEAGLIVGEQNVVDRLQIVDGDTLLGDARTAGVVRVIRLFRNGLDPVRATAVDDLVSVAGTLVRADAAAELSRAGTIAISEGVRFDTTQVTGG